MAYEDRFGQQAQRSKYDCLLFGKAFKQNKFQVPSINKFSYFSLQVITMKVNVMQI